MTGRGNNAVASFLTSDKKASLDATFLSGGLAGEADIAGGFGATVGMHYILCGTIKEKDDTTNRNIKIEKTAEETADAALWSLGVYYKQDSLRLDASYGKDFLHNGPYFVSGIATKQALLARISASYAF